MSQISTLGLPVRPEAHRQEDTERAGGAKAIASLTLWMVILGTIRLVCAAAESVQAYLEASRPGVISTWELSSFWQNNPAVYVLAGAWPLVLGLALWRTRWPELVKAGALTFLILSVGGVLTAAADWSQTSGRFVAIGSFPVPRMAWGRLAPFGMAVALAGAVQLLLELMTAVRAAVLVFRRHNAGDPSVDRPTAARRSRFGRLAAYVSVAFLLLTVRLPAWSAYLELLNQSRVIREFILRDDLARTRTRTAPPSPAPASEWAAEARILLDAGEQAWGEGRYLTSSENYSHLGGLLDTIPTATMNAAERQLGALSYNNWAWLMAACPDPTFRNHAASVKYARRALDLMPNEGNTWNTLGVAYFRQGAWDEAQSAFYRSMELRNEGDSFDWFYLAMIHAKLGRKERAREWYDKAAQWARSNHYRRDGRVLYEIEVEAAETLGLPKPEPPPLPQVPSVQPIRLPHLTPRTLRSRG